MTSRTSFHDEARGRCTAFIIMVNGGDSDNTSPIPIDTVSTIAGINHPSVKAPESTIWSDISGNIAARIWSNDTLPDAHHRLHAIAGSPIDVHGRLVGQFAEIDIDRNGHGVVRQDPYGLHPLYVGNACGFTLIANRPHLVATGLEHLTGEPARRDRRFAAWLAFSGYPIGDRTGYESVRCVPFGTTVHIESNSGVEFRSAPPPWLVSETNDIESHIDRIESELIANLRRAISVAGHTPRFQLTGGRDSRLILALLVRADLLHDIEIVTLGAPNAADAIIAKELTAQLRVNHIQLPWNNGVVDRGQLCGHVGCVAGAVNCVDSSIPVSTEERMTLSGFVGETLRTNWSHSRAGYGDDKSVVNGYLSMPLGKTRILRKDACFNALTEGIQSVLAPAEHGARPEDLFDAYYIQHRIRRWLSARPERFAHEFFPLYYPPATELAFRMGWRDRVAGRLHNTIIRRAGMQVSEPSYYKPGKFYKPESASKDTRQYLRHRAAGRLRDTAIGRIRRLYYESGHLYESMVIKWLDELFAKKTPLPTRIHNGPSSNTLIRRQTAYREIIAARDQNPIFDIINQDRLVAAVGALQELPASAANEIHGAMTGVIWLGRLETEI